MQDNAFQNEFPFYGEIFDVALEPVRGSEIGKLRPALVVSNNVNNEYSNTVTLLPITSQPDRKVYPFEVSVPSGTGGLTSNSRIKADQIRTVDKSRLKHRRGSLPEVFLADVQSAMKVHLNII